MKGTKGFTLLELLMVVIIIAILAAIALPQYLRASEKSRASEALQVLGALRASEQRYKAQHNLGNYTLLVTDLDMAFGLMNSWNAPVIAITAAGATPATGMATVTRNAGTYINQGIGIQFGTGTICGTAAPFAPMGTLPVCAQN